MRIRGGSSLPMTWPMRIIREVQPSSAMDALDYGCGTGLVTLRLPAAGQDHCWSGTARRGCSACWRQRQKSSIFTKCADPPGRFLSTVEHWSGNSIWS